MTTSCRKNVLFNPDWMDSNGFMTGAIPLLDEVGDDILYGSYYMELHASYPIKLPGCEHRVILGMGKKPERVTKNVYAFAITKNRIIQSTLFCMPNWQTDTINGERVGSTAYDYLIPAAANIGRTDIVVHKNDGIGGIPLEIWRPFIHEHNEVYTKVWELIPNNAMARVVVSPRRWDIPLDCFNLNLWMIEMIDLILSKISEVGLGMSGRPHITAEQVHPAMYNYVPDAGLIYYASEVLGIIDWHQSAHPMRTYQKFEEILELYAAYRAYFTKFSESCGFGIRSQ